MIEATGSKIVAAYLARDLVCVLENEEQVRNAQVNLKKVKQLDGLLLHLSAKGTNYDCVSRSFAPKLNVAEDPVCGSGHCHLIPYWTKQLHKDNIIAYQASKRGGTLYCKQDGNRIKIAGQAVLYAKGDLCLNI